MFHLGELHHIVFAMIAEYNEGSCLNKILIDSEIYGENTLKQILGGKDMEMSVAAHTPFI